MEIVCEDLTYLYTLHHNSRVNSACTVINKELSPYTYKRAGFSLQVKQLVPLLAWKPKPLLGYNNHDTNDCAARVAEIDNKSSKIISLLLESWRSKM